MAKQKTNHPRVGLGVFVWKDGKFLMEQRIGAHGAGSWSIPGGWLEYGESIEDCAKREIAEETGMEIENIRFIALTNNIFEKEQIHSVTIWVESDWAANEPRICEPDKFIKQEWRTFKSLPQPLFMPWQELKKARPELFN